MKAIAALVAAMLTAAESRSVTVSIDGEPAIKEAFESSLRELLGRLELGLNRYGDPDSATLAAVKADFTSPSEISVTVIDSLGRTVLLRRMPRAGSVPLDAEAAAHVVHSVVEELARGAPQPPTTAPPTAEPPLVTAPEREAPDAVGLDLQAFFGGRTFSATAPFVVGGGAALSARVPMLGLKPAFTLVAEYHAPMDTVGDRITLRVQTVSVRLLGALQFFSAGRWRADAGLGAGLDIFITSFPIHDVPPMFEHPGAAASPIVAGLARLHFSLARSTEVSLGVTLDVDLRPPRFVVGVGPMATESVFALWRVRPAVVLGVSWDTLK